MSYIIELMCIYQLSGGNSMNECGIMSDPILVREELCHGHRISRKTIERGLGLLDLYFEETIMHIWERLNEIYPELDIDVSRGRRRNDTVAGPVHGSTTCRIGSSHIGRGVQGESERSSAVR